MNDFKHFRGRGRGQFQHNNFRGQPFNNIRRGNPNAFPPLMHMPPYRERWPRPKMWRGRGMPPYLRQGGPIFHKPPPVIERPPSPLPGSEEARQRAIAEASARIQQQLNLTDPTPVSNTQGQVPLTQIPHTHSASFSEQIPVPAFTSFTDDTVAVEIESHEHNSLNYSPFFSMNFADDRPPTSSIPITDKVKKKSKRQPEFVTTSTVEELRNKILNQFNSMSKGKIQNLVNNPGSSKYDNYLHHLVRDMRLHLSQELRTMYNNREEEASSDMIDRFNSIVPDLGVELVSLPDTMVAELSKILQFDMNTEVTHPPIDTPPPQLLNCPIPDPTIPDTINLIPDIPEHLPEPFLPHLNSTFCTDITSNFLPSVDNIDNIDNINTTLIPENNDTYDNNELVEPEDIFKQAETLLLSTNFLEGPTHLSPGPTHLSPIPTHMSPGPTQFLSPDSTLSVDPFINREPLCNEPPPIEELSTDLLEATDMEIDENIDENSAISDKNTDTSNLDEIPLPETNLDRPSHDASPFSKKLLEMNISDSTVEPERTMFQPSPNRSKSPFKNRAQDIPDNPEATIAAQFDFNSVFVFKQKELLNVTSFLDDITSKNFVDPPSEMQNINFNPIQIKIPQKINIVPPKVSPVAEKVMSVPQIPAKSKKMIEMEEEETKKKNRLSLDERIKIMMKMQETTTKEEPCKKKEKCNKDKRLKLRQKKEYDKIKVKVHVENYKNPNKPENKVEEPVIDLTDIQIKQEKLDSDEENSQHSIPSCSTNTKTTVPNQPITNKSVPAVPTEVKKNTMPTKAALKDIPPLDLQLPLILPHTKQKSKTQEAQNAEPVKKLTYKDIPGVRIKRKDVKGSENSPKEKEQVTDKQQTKKHNNKQESQQRDVHIEQHPAATQVTQEENNKVQQQTVAVQIKQEQEDLQEENTKIQQHTVQQQVRKTQDEQQPQQQITAIKIKQEQHNKIQQKQIAQQHTKPTHVEPQQQQQQQTVTPQIKHEQQLKQQNKIQQHVDVVKQQTVAPHAKQQQQNQHLQQQNKIQQQTHTKQIQVEKQHVDVVKPQQQQTVAPHTKQQQQQKQQQPTVAVHPKQIQKPLLQRPSVDKQNIKVQQQISNKEQKKDPRIQQQEQQKEKIPEHQNKDIEQQQTMTHHIKQNKEQQQTTPTKKENTKEKNDFKIVEETSVDSVQSTEEKTSDSVEQTRNNTVIKEHHKQLFKREHSHSPIPDASSKIKVQETPSKIVQKITLVRQKSIENKILEDAVAKSVEKPKIQKIEELHNPAQNASKENIEIQKKIDTQHVEDTNIKLQQKEIKKQDTTDETEEKEHNKEEQKNIDTVLEKEEKKLEKNVDKDHNKKEQKKKDKSLEREDKEKELPLDKEMTDFGSVHLDKEMTNKHLEKEEKKDPVIDKESNIHEENKKNQEDIKKNHEESKKNHEEIKKNHEEGKKNHEEGKKNHEEGKKNHEEGKKDHEDSKKNHEDSKKKRDKSLENEEKEKEKITEKEVKKTDKIPEEESKKQPDKEEIIQDENLEKHHERTQETEEKKRSRSLEHEEKKRDRSHEKETRKSMEHHREKSLEKDKNQRHRSKEKHKSDSHRIEEKEKHERAKSEPKKVEEKRKDKKPDEEKREGSVSRSKSRSQTSKSTKKPDIIKMEQSTQTQDIPEICSVVLPENQFDESVAMNRLMDIDLQIQKLMQEKFQLYQKLNFANFSFTKIMPNSLDNAEKNTTDTVSVAVGPDTTIEETSSKIDDSPVKEPPLSKKRKKSSHSSLDKSEEKNKYVKPTEDDSDHEYPKRMRKRRKSVSKAVPVVEIETILEAESSRKRSKLNRRPEPKRNTRNTSKELKNNTFVDLEFKNSDADISEEKTVDYSSETSNKIVENPSPKTLEKEENEENNKSENKSPKKRRKKPNYNSFFEDNPEEENKKIFVKIRKPEKKTKPALTETEENSENEDLDGKNEVSKRIDDIIKKNEEVIKKSQELAKKNEEQKKNEEMSQKNDDITKKNDDKNDITKKNEDMTKKNEETPQTEEISPSTSSENLSKSIKEHEPKSKKRKRRKEKSNMEEIETEQTNNNRQEVENMANNNESTIAKIEKLPEFENKAVRSRLTKTELRSKERREESEERITRRTRRAAAEDKVSVDDNSSHSSENLLIRPPSTSSFRKKVRKYDDDVRRSRSRSISKESDHHKDKISITSKSTESSDEEERLINRKRRKHSSESLKPCFVKLERIKLQESSPDVEYFADSVEEKGIEQIHKIIATLEERLEDLKDRTLWPHEKEEKDEKKVKEKEEKVKEKEEKKVKEKEEKKEKQKEIEEKEEKEESNKELKEKEEKSKEMKKETDEKREKEENTEKEEKKEKEDKKEKEEKEETKDIVEGKVEVEIEEPKQETQAITVEEEKIDKPSEEMETELETVMEETKEEDKKTEPEVGSEVAVARKEDGGGDEVIMEDEDTGIFCKGHQKSILDIKILGDEFLAASEDGVIYKYCVQSGELQDAYTGHKRAVTCMYVVADPGQAPLLYSGSLDCTLRCYNLDTAEVLHAVAVSQAIQCMDAAWGYIFLGTYEGLLFIYNMKKRLLHGESLTIASATVLMMRATTEGSRQVLILASRKREIMVRDAFTGLLLRTMCHDQRPTVYSLLLHRSLVYCGTSDKGILILDFNNGTQRGVYNCGKGVVCMVLYKTLLFAGCYDGLIYVYNTRTQMHVRTLPGPGDGMLLSLAISHGMIIAGTKKEHLLKIWKIPKDILNELE